MDNFDRYESEILKGLPNEKQRLDSAQENLEFFEGYFDRYREGITPNRYDSHRSDRSSWIFNFIVRKLTESLFKNKPQIAVKDNPEATRWLQGVYKDANMFGKWQAADQLSLVTQAVCFHVVGTDDPIRPIKIQLYSANQFHVWEDDVDPCLPAAVVLVDKFDCQRRYRLFTTDYIGTYICDKWEQGMTAGKTAMKRVSIEENPYHTLPMTFAHFTLPTTKFWNYSPGDYLRSLNSNINDRLTQIDRAQKVYLKPPMLAFNVDAKFNPRYYEAGDVVSASSADNEHNEYNPPDVRLMEFDQNAVPTAWKDLQNYMEHVFETMGVPGSTFRMVATAGRSGESIKAETLPLMAWAKSRQPMWHHYETQLAEKVIEIAVKHFELNGQAVPPFLSTALVDFELSLRWGEAWTEVPGDARDRADLFLLQLGLTSKVQLLMRRNGYTEVEAIAELEEVARHQKEEIRILGPELAAAMPNSPPVGESGAEGEQTDPEDEQDQESEE